jgi:hypothetical protein
MTLTELVQVGVALGASGTGLGSVLAAGAYALRKRSDAQLARANAARVAAEAHAAAEERTNATLASFERRLDECMERHEEERAERERIEREAHQRDLRCERRMTTLRNEVDSLRGLIRGAGIKTPAPFPAVSPDVKEDT